MNSRSVLMLSLTAALLVSGCNDPVKAPGAVGADPLPPQYYAKIAGLQELDKFLVMGTPPRVDNGPPMKVTCAIRTKTDYQELDVQYRYFFFTAGGVPLNDNPDWQFKHLPSRTETFFSGNAL